MFLLFLQSTIERGWEQWISEGVAVSLVVAFLIFLLRALPTWRVVKLAEITVREKEADSRTKQAESFGQLSMALGSMSNLLRDVTIEQRHATEKLQILQRANTDTSERVADTVDVLVEKVEDIDRRIAESN